ncbi:MAG: BREX-1 system phosphatase PglZ type B [Magnetococcales bacterium]|nr:BREX-1 system phosphatase PglZ type B [Magnetococcales bacterium]
MRIIDRLIQAIRSAATHNPEATVPPDCILWPDKDRQWEPIIPRLLTEMPELLVLGPYEPDKRTGPAIWLRCAMAGKGINPPLPNATIPVLYLPGFGRQDLRAVEECPEVIKPLAELQYRGTIWSQVNGKDWTIRAFLKADRGGLGLDVAMDQGCGNAMQMALYRLLDEEIQPLTGRRLDHAFFNTLLAGDDPIRDILQWLDRGESFREERDKNTWSGFVAVCKLRLGFDPDNDGPLGGAARLAAHEGAWRAVWDRFCEAPKRYPHIPALIRKTTTPRLLFADLSGWPQHNDQEERSLRGDLLPLETWTPHKIRQRLQELETRHGGRRAWVWAELGESPLALALSHLLALAEASKTSLASGTVEEMAASYRNLGWQADDAALRALSNVRTEETLTAVRGILRALYFPWLEDAARHLQQEVQASGYPDLDLGKEPPPSLPGDCILFVDGLRLDTARRLAQKLAEDGYSVAEHPRWSALPSVTATGKPAVTPVRHLLAVQEDQGEFEPCVAKTNQSLKGGYALRKLLETEGWQILDASGTGNPMGRAWCTFGNVDHEGHERGWKLAQHLDALLDEIAHRSTQLLKAGWRRIQIRTDHGWLLLPGGLPKRELAASLSETRWGRCAVLKPGARTGAPLLMPWSWNPHLSVALADGVCCYRAGMEYAHGGLSLQECLTLDLTVTATGSNETSTSLSLVSVHWKGMRCKVTIAGKSTGLALDIRTHPGNPNTSVVKSIRPFAPEKGESSVVVEDDGLEGSEATIVILDDTRQLMAQQPTLIGGGEKR